MTEGAFSSGYITAEDKLRLVIEGVAISEIENSTIEIKKNTEGTFRSYLGTSSINATPLEFIRSAIIRIKGLSVSESDSDMAEISIQLPVSLLKPIQGSTVIEFHV